jgi:hypothetical protein
MRAVELAVNMIGAKGVQEAKEAVATDLRETTGIKMQEVKDAVIAAIRAREEKQQTKVA